MTTTLEENFWTGRPTDYAVGLVTLLRFQQLELVLRSLELEFDFFQFTPNFYQLLLICSQELNLIQLRLSPLRLPLQSNDLGLASSSYFFNSMAALRRILTGSGHRQQENILLLLNSGSVSSKRLVTLVDCPSPCNSFPFSLLRSPVLLEKFL